MSYAGLFGYARGATVYAVIWLLNDSGGLFSFDSVYLCVNFIDVGFF